MNETLPNLTCFRTSRVISNLSFNRSPSEVTLLSPRHQLDYSRPGCHGNASHSPFSNLILSSSNFSVVGGVAQTLHRLSPSALPSHHSLPTLSPWLVHSFSQCLRACPKPNVMLIGRSITFVSADAQSLVGPNRQSPGLWQCLGWYTHSEG